MFASIYNKRGARVKFSRHAKTVPKDLYCYLFSQKTLSETHNKWGKTGYNLAKILLLGKEPLLWKNFGINELCASLHGVGFKIHALSTGILGKLDPPAERMGAYCDLRRTPYGVALRNP